MTESHTATAILDPASVLTPAEIQAARARAADAPPFNAYQRDRLSSIFGPTVRQLQQSNPS